MGVPDWTSDLIAVRSIRYDEKTVKKLLQRIDEGKAQVIAQQFGDKWVWKMQNDLYNYDTGSSSYTEIGSVGKERKETL